MVDVAVSFLVQYLSQLLAKEQNLFGRVKGEVDSIHRDLKMISIFLQNSEGKRNEHGIGKEVVRKIREAAYEAEDVLDTFILEAEMRRRRDIIGKTSSLAFRGASSSTLSTHQWTHDVFLNFTIADTRRNFIADLYDAFDRRGIKTYIDDEQQHKRGNFISSSIFKAIEKSRISIVVFSQNYASSPWCLEELLKIVECMETKGQIVLPVFYKVNPSDVRYTRGSFGDAFAKHDKRFKADQRKVVRWKTALARVADLSGWHLDNNSNEAQFIDKLVRKIASHTDLKVAKHPDGTESHVEEPYLYGSPLGDWNEAQILDKVDQFLKKIRNLQFAEYPAGIESPALEPYLSSSPSPIGIESPAQEPHLSSSPSPVGIESLVEEPLLYNSPSPGGIESSVQEPHLSSSLSPVGIESPAQEPHLSSSPSPVGIESLVEEPLLSNSPSPIGIESLAQEPHLSSPPSSVGIESLVEEPLLSNSPSLVGIESPAQEPHLSSSPSPVGIESLEEEPLLSNSLSPVGIESPVQEQNLSRSPSPLGIESVVQETLLSSLLSGNSEQGSNSSISSQGVILILIGLVIGLLQLGNLFETHPVNMWIAIAASVMCSLSYAAMTKINGTHWAKYSQIIDIFRILSGTLVLVSLASIHLPHQLWWLFFVIWAPLAFIIVAGTWIYSRAEGRGVETTISLPQV